MAHFARVENGVVAEVLVCKESETPEGLSGAFGGTWIQTSYNTVGGQHLLGGTPLRKNYAGVGHTYDAQRDAFIPSKPFPSWILNEDSCLWEPPIAHPGGLVVWNEDTLTWDAA